MYSQYPQAPYGPPQPPPKKKPNYWLIGCFGCGGALALIVGVIIIVAVVLNNDDDNSGGSAAPGTPPASEGAGDGGSGEEETAPANNGEPVSIVAESVEYEPSSISDGSEYVAVHVTVTNNGDESLSVNPLYFSMQDSSGQSTDADLMESSAQQDDLFEAKDLASGESEDGIIVFPGSTPPTTITHTDVMGNEYSGDVS